MYSRDGDDTCAYRLVFSAAAERSRIFALGADNILFQKVKIETFGSPFLLALIQRDVDGDARDDIDRLHNLQETREKSRSY